MPTTASPLAYFRRKFSTMPSFMLRMCSAIKHRCRFDFNHEFWSLSIPAFERTLSVWVLLDVVVGEDRGVGGVGVLEAVPPQRVVDGDLPGWVELLQSQVGGLLPGPEERPADVSPHLVVHQLSWNMIDRLKGDAFKASWDALPILWRTATNFFRKGHHHHPNVRHKLCQPKIPLGCSSVLWKS